MKIELTEPQVKALIAAADEAEADHMQYGTATEAELAVLRRARGILAKALKSARGQS